MLIESVFEYKMLFKKLKTRVITCVISTQVNYNTIFIVKIHFIKNIFIIFTILLFIILKYLLIYKQNLVRYCFHCQLLHISALIVAHFLAKTSFAADHYSAI